MSVAISVETTPSVREFQKIYALCNTRISESSQLETRAFWVNQLQVELHKICSAYGVSVDSLISQWELWVSNVEAARLKAVR